MPFPAATGAELGHQSGQKDKQTDKQPQAAGTGRIRAAAAGSSAGVREPGAGDQRPQAAGSGARCRRSAAGAISCSHRRGIRASERPEGETVKQPQAAGTGQIWPESGQQRRDPSADDLHQDPEQLQQPEQREILNGCRRSAATGSGIRSRVPEF